MRRGTTRVAVGALACALALGGCSGGGEEKPRATSTPTPTSAPDPMAAPAALAKVTGRLPGPARQQVVEGVTRVVDGWLEAAYLGDFPRTDFAPAFAGFTPGAAARARRDAALMTNAALSPRIEQATATARTLSLDVLSVRQRPVGVTATVDLAFQTTGTVSGAQHVRGTLDLTPTGSGWRVFGFDITRTPA